MRYPLFLIAFFSILVPATVSAGTIHLSPDRDVQMVGGSLTVEVLVDSSESIYAAEAQLIFDPQKLRVESIVTDGSILTLWPTPPSFNNEEGSIMFSGWAERRFLGASGMLVTIVFDVVRSGISDVEIVSGAILAADGGSNIVDSMRGGSYTLEPARTIPDSIPFIFPGGVDPGVEVVQEEEVTTSVGEGVLEEVSGQEELVAPFFEEYSPVISGPDRIVIRGTAPPNARVVIYVETGDDVEQGEVRSASDGSFTFVSDQKTERGVYRVWAIAVDDSGAESPPSEQVTITIETSSGMAALAALTTEVLPTFMGLLALLVASGLLIGYVANKRMRKRIEASG